MADTRRSAPFRAQDPHEVTRMVNSLTSHTKKGPSKGGFSVKKATYELSDGRTIDSWRMQDWDYKKPNLPTYARGLFTRKNDRTQQEEIVVRGYDKFFNHGEVPKTEWKNVKANTRGTYELSVKENGCIIFIAGLDDQTIIVCSKHSTGPRDDPDKSHAIIGERWLEKHLAGVGKTKADLAKELRRMNATAVAELCDDAFEEHVLAYEPDVAGLYLHGINLNLPEFATYPHHLVDEFAKTWGMRQVTHILEDNIDNVQKFLDQTANTGAYDGRDTEGFVIRCQARDGEHGEWHDWFFKYKFEEPYLMYRQWRECTKAIISGRQPRYKKHKRITEEYLLFARRRLAKEKDLGRQYQQNHGIIALRDDFLKYKGVTGAQVIQNEMDTGEEGEVAHDVILVPIATIGCGKTTIGIALCKLFGWGEFQNDNVEGKGNRAQKFVTNVTMMLAESPVVFADRNNHQKRERSQFIEDVTRIVPKATFVALHFVHDRNNIEAIRERTRQRVLARGDNHQTIQAGTKGPEEICGIMDGFIKRFQALDRDSPPDADFDLVIDLDPLAPARDNLETVITKLNEAYPKLMPAEMPSAHDIDDAIDYAMTGYSPTNKIDLSRGGGKAKPGTKKAQQANAQTTIKPKKAPKVEYFGVRISPARVTSILETVFKEQPTNRAKFYRHLSQSRRLQSEFHVTLIHRSGAGTHPEEWKRLEKLYNDARERHPDTYEPDLGVCGVHLERIIWDGRIMCFVARLINSDVGEPFETVNRVAHVTCGTGSQDIKPKESNDLLARWLEGGEDVEGVFDEKIKGNVVLDGVVKGIVQRF